MSGEVTMALIGLATIAANGWIAVYQTRAMKQRTLAESQKIGAETVSALTAAAGDMVDKLREEVARKQAECSERIDALSTDYSLKLDGMESTIATMQTRLAEQQTQIDELTLHNARLTRALAVAAHQVQSAGLSPLWEA